MVDRPTLDGRVSVSSPERSGWRIFFSRFNFLCWLLFWYPFHPRVTALARKKSQSFCQKRWWQVTAKHMHPVYILYVCVVEQWHCKLVHGSVWCKQNVRRDNSSFTWYQPCNNQTVHHFGGYSKTRFKSYSLMQNHMRVQWVCLRAENSAIYKSDQ